MTTDASAGAATDVTARAVNTVAWLSAADTAIVVPVYQRQYRWDIGRCAQLLTDVRAIADDPDRRAHFLGSILSSAGPGPDGTAPGPADPGDAGDPDAGASRPELVLIDGQQRLTTLMLLAAAVQHTLAAAHPDTAAAIGRMMVRADGSGPKLRPHPAWAAVFERVVLGRPGTGPVPDSRFDDNYAFFRSQISAADAPRVWRGLTRLEHVAISLGPEAGAQQIFESLNATGEPLRDEELIHNYVLMGLTHAQQMAVETEFWGPIEAATGENIGRFWRHYLVMVTGREVGGPAGTGERGVYDAFRARFPRPDPAGLREQAAEWLAYARIHAILTDPDLADDPGVAAELRGLNAFGPGTYPLLMRAYRSAATGATTPDDLIGLIAALQSLLLRRTVVEIGTDRLVARLCRAGAAGPDALIRAIARITPSDDRVRIALKYRPLPQAGYVLARLAGVDRRSAFDVEHVLPLSPGEGWTGDGVRRWAAYSDDEQNASRALARTLGNLTLLEQPLADRAEELSFPAKRDAVYGSSAVPSTAALTAVPTWDTAAIAARTARLTGDLLRVWARPGPAGTAIEDDGLTPVLDAVLRRGWPRGWQREFDYVEFRGEHWEVPDVKYLFNRIFRRLLADDRPAVERYVAGRGGPLFAAPAWNGAWDELPGGRHLYMGWDSRYMMTAVQGVLSEAGLAAEVHLKYSYIGEGMR